MTDLNTPPTPEPPAPYAGAIHDELAWHIVKYLADDAVLRSEHEVEPGAAMPGTLFTFDFAVECNGRTVAFEIGGARNLPEHSRQLRRDATVLATGAADAVFRLRGSDILDHMEDVLYLAQQWEPEMFSERGKINLLTLASQEARAITLRPEQPSAMVPYAQSKMEEQDPARALWHVANGQSPHILVRRLDRRFPDVWQPYAHVDSTSTSST